MPKGNLTLVCAALAAILACSGCQAGNSEQAGGAASEQSSSAAQYKDSAGWLNSDIDGAVTEDSRARPQDDFALATNKGLLLSLTIPAGQTQTGGFYVVAQQADELRLKTIQDSSMEGHDADLVRAYYAMLMDWDTRDEQGVKPALPYIEAIRSISSLDEMTAWFANRDLGGIFAYERGGDHTTTGCLFSYSVSASRDDPAALVLDITPIGLSLNDPAEYKELSKNGQTLKDLVVARWTVLLEHLGFSDEESAQIIDNAFSFEELLAERQLDQEKLNDPATLGELWNPTDLEGVTETAAAFPVKEILEGWGLDKVNIYNVEQPEYLKSLDAIYVDENLDLMRDWLTVLAAEQWSSYLDRATRDDVQAAEAKVRGIEGAESDEMVAMRRVDADLRIPLDNMYIAKYCRPELRDEIEALIKTLVAEYRELLKSETWLTEATREKAIGKLDAMTIRAAYPEQIETWDGLTFEGADSLLEANLRARRYTQDTVLSKVNEPRDKSAWNRLLMPVSTVNACYEPSDNSINIPVGILNGVIYQSDYSYEEKLGIIGMIIGHEISHAFDPTGAQYDKDGRLASWWTDEDSAAFDGRAKKVIDYYDSLEVVGGIKYSGARVQGEAIADMGGIKCALRIASGIPDFDYRKFFESYAKLWAIRRIESEEIKRAQTDSHPLGYLRINVPLMQFEEFRRTYEVKEGDAMYVAPDDSICVW